MNLYFHADDDGYICCPVEVLEEIIKEEPTADVRENKHGKWVYDEEQSKDHVEKIYICSNCHDYSAWGEVERISFNFCPNCGATMWKGEEE